MSVTDIDENEFVKNVMNKFSEIVTENPPAKENIKRAKLPKKWRPEQEYCGYVFRRMTQLLDTMEDLKSITMFIKRFPNKKALRNITKEGYFQYHIENFYIRSCSLLDKLCLLINEIFLLGLPARFAKPKVLYGMRQLKDTRAIKVLKLFERFINQGRQMRNYVDHEGKYEDKKLNEIAMYSLIERCTPEKEFKYSDVLNFLIREYITMSSQRMKGIVTAIEGFLDGYFKELNEHFEIKYKELSTD